MGPCGLQLARQLIQRIQTLGLVLQYRQSQDLGSVGIKLTLITLTLTILEGQFQVFQA